MQTLRMNTDLLHPFLEGLRAWGTLYAPVERGPGVYAIEPVEDVGMARPDALRTILPLKKLLLRPRFTMVETQSSLPMAPGGDNILGPMVYFGAHSCDVHALKIMDLLYLTEYPDPFYKKNREALTIVGYGCFPDEKCFCHSLGTANVDDGFDLFLTPSRGAFS